MTFKFWEAPMPSKVPAAVRLLDNSEFEWTCDTPTDDLYRFCNNIVIVFTAPLSVIGMPEIAVKTRAVIKIDLSNYIRLGDHLSELIRLAKLAANVGDKQGKGKQEPE
jgi:hypothetical protein